MKNSEGKESLMKVEMKTEVKVDLICSTKCDISRELFLLTLTKISLLFSAIIIGFSIQSSVHESEEANNAMGKFSYHLSFFSSWEDKEGR